MTSPITTIRRVDNRRPLKVLDVGHFKIGGVYCKLIPLTKGQYTIVWESDYELISKINWFAHWDAGTRSYYAKTNLKMSDGSTITHSMHRMIMGLKPYDSQEVDHIESGNTLDNRRANLRICEHLKNSHNRRKNRGTVSGFKGVTWHERDKIFEASIRINGKLKYLGRSKNPAICHELYRIAAKQHFGEFARFE